LPVIDFNSLGTVSGVSAAVDAREYIPPIYIPFFISLKNISEKDIAHVSGGHKSILCGKSRKGIFL
jgi:hypothetical protein